MFYRWVEYKRLTGPHIFADQDLALLLLSNPLPYPLPKPPAL